MNEIRVNERMVLSRAERMGVKIEVVRPARKANTYYITYKRGNVKSTLKREGARNAWDALDEIEGKA